MAYYCPRCGEPFAGDEDRLYDSFCEYCGWSTPARKKRDAINRERFRRVRESELRTTLLDILSPL